jgi:hypothetical protein
LKPRHAAALALVGASSIAIVFVSAEDTRGVKAAQQIPTSSTRASWCPEVPASPAPPHFEPKYGTWAEANKRCLNVTDNDSDQEECVGLCFAARDLWNLTKAGRAEAAIAANAWVRKVPHVKYVVPDFMRGENPVSPTPFWGIGVFVDKSENVREVAGKVPPQLDGVRVLVIAAPVVFWCLSVVEGMNVSKECSECRSDRLGKEVAKDCSKWCAATLEGEAHSCEKEFKTKAQCELGAAKYVQDWYVDADKNGDVVGIASTVHCWEITDPYTSALRSDY